MMALVGYLCIFIVLASIVHASPACGPFQDNANQLIFFPQVLLRNPAQFPQSPSFQYQSLTWTLNASAQLVVTESTGNVVYVLGSPQTPLCSTINKCTFTLQNDGNLVTYMNRSGRWDGVWASWTYGGAGIFAKFSTSQPYVSIVAPDCSTAWPGGSIGLPPDVSKPRTTPVLGATNSATVSFSNTAIPASKWRYQLAVNSHISQGWSSSMVLAKTLYLGAGAIREGKIPTSGTQQYSDYLAMNANGVKLAVIAGGTADISGLQSQVNNWATFQSATSMIQSVEGFNEINNFGFTYNGINPQQSYSGMYQAQKDLYSLVKSNSVLKNLPVYDLTGNCFGPGDTAAVCNNIAGRADKTNLHPYPGRGEPAVSLGNSNNFLLLGLDGYGTSASNNVVTESGWHTDSFTNGISELAEAKLQVNELLSFIAAGNLKTFIYELIDETWSGYNGDQSHYGLFRNSTTNFAPKPSARAIHFLSSLLNDTGAGATDSLTYSLTGFPYAAQRLLFQNSAKTFFLVLWNNVPVWNPVTNTDISNNAVSVTLNLPWTTTINVFDIYSSQSDTIPLSPISTASSSSTSFFFSDKAVIISFAQPVGATPAPTPRPTPRPTPLPTVAPTPRSCPGKNILDQNNFVSSASAQPVLTSTNCAYTLSIDSVTGKFQIKNGGTTVVYTSTVWSQDTAAFQLTMQADGNLVMYGRSNPVWSSGTGFGYGYSGTGPFTAQLGTDGHLRVIDGTSQTVLWSS